jgi:DNA-binding NarL/FixJ family response regulator
VMTAAALQRGGIRNPDFPCARVTRSIAILIRPGQRSLADVERVPAMKIFVLDSHTIYCRGLAACLEAMEDVEAVAHAESVREAWDHPLLLEADVVVLDNTLPGGGDFIGAVREATGARVIVCTSRCDEENVLAVLQAGAIGFLRKDTLTGDGLSSAVQAAVNGAGVVAPDLLGSLLKAIQPESLEKPPPAKLTDREQQVLALIAEGHPTREVALRLSYSERTVKNVLHDVVTKLNARSRSQAIAFAVREGLI